MAWLPDSEKILKIYLLVLTECTNATDRQTDTHTPHCVQHMAAKAKAINNYKF